jgi:hypothetical protein
VTHREREALVEEAASAWRPRRPDGALGPHPAWADLDAPGRAEVHALAAASRRLEAALDPEGLSSSGRAILARLRG